ncbi:hypothetical protein OG884_02580 [Streptosporangium sp. NBC_01755]|uniref:hypothetical protein n=1 Tax=unclassified Streptosporangium TaxID=2632669 RepID=UPI002DD9B5F8|nr:MULTISPECIES: hypothetical protein [unclassified Streptosporangium]WSA27681.1 hypothetical protein OIE13_07355 [Streptosporangium sp. NBC_01810]WSD00845.1 hypothetical protein OG884_02580 [Streptosporangium sp. NBC_01755]
MAARRFFSRSLPPGHFSTPQWERLLALVAQIDNLVGANGTERFEFGLDLLLRGLVSHIQDAGPTTKD